MGWLEAYTEAANLTGTDEGISFTLTGHIMRVDQSDVMADDSSAVGHYAQFPVMNSRPTWMLGMARRSS